MADDLRDDFQGDLHFSILGLMRARRGTTQLKVGSPQQQAMLAVLLLKPGRAARATDLIDALWARSRRARR